MKMMLHEVFGYILSLMLCAGCSVKEDRSVCPCRLVLDFSEVDTTLLSYADVEITSQDGYLFEERIESDGFSPEYMVTVPRRQLQLCVWNGREGFEYGDGLRIPYGEEAPEVYFHSSAIDAECEKLREVVRMRKNHCRMTVVMKGEDVNPVAVSIIGNVDGYAADGRPTSGSFRCSSEVASDGSCTVVLPRQNDNSLIMELEDGSGVLKKFPIGEYIAESGYDWTAPDLVDITVGLDFAVTHLTLVIQGWEKEHKFDIVI